VYGPAGLQTIIETQLSYTGSRLSYPLHFHSIDGLADGEVLFEDEQVQVSGLNLEHGVPCYGFLFIERHKRFKLDKSTVQKYPPPVPAYPYLQNGYDYTDQAGKLYKADTYILRNPEKRSFAYLTDTLVQPHLTQWLKGVTVLYHEATFTSELIERARKTHHTTSAQAAALARDSKVQQLLIGHFSARYGNLEPLLAEAKETFANTALAEEGCTFEIRQANATETLS
jgi:ribonuclease Z